MSKTKKTKIVITENKTVKILFHEISYYYDNDQKMPEIEEEHVKEMINNGFSSGELNFYDHKTDQEIRGWWEIDFKQD
jgi:hypothetical protein